MAEQTGIISAHGGYRNLKAYQTAEIIYDATVKFCQRYLPQRVRPILLFV